MRRERFLTELRANSVPTKTEMLIYSGTPVYRFDWMTGQEYMLQLSLDAKHVDMGRMLAGAPITIDHWRDTSATVGAVENPRLSPEGLIAEARRFEEGEAAEVWAKVDSGVLRALSVEAYIKEREDVTPKGVKGMRQFLATSWEPQAVSIVAVGADPAAQFLSEEYQDFWVPEQYRRSAQFDAGAASVSNRQVLTHLLLKRRTR